MRQWSVSIPTPRATHSSKRNATQPNAMYPQVTSQAQILTSLVALLLGAITCVASRSIRTDNLIIGNTERPPSKPVMYELDEDMEEKLLVNNDQGSSQGGDYYSRSGLMFNMPIAVAILFSVILLICCFCCLRCAVDYEGYKKTLYCRPKKLNPVDVVRILKLDEPIKK